MKKALISGITGQDGAYLAEFLSSKGYEVHGIKRRASSFNTDRIDHLYQAPHKPNKNFYLHYGDLSDSSNLIRLMQEIQPDEVYNLGTQSHVAVSFESPEYTADTVGLGTLRMLEAIRIAGLEKKTRFYQVSTSELYGDVQEIPQKETTPLREDSLLTDVLEPTNEHYTVAKIAGIKFYESCNRQYGTDFRSVMPTNLYGINDNFHPKNSHVIPALMRRFHEAKLNNNAEVVVWGSVTPIA